MVLKFPVFELCGICRFLTAPVSTSCLKFIGSFFVKINLKRYAMKHLYIIMLLLFSISLLSSCYLNKGGIYTVKDVRIGNNHPIVKFRHYNGWYNIYGYGKDTLNIPNINEEIVITVRQHKPINNNPIRGKDIKNHLDFVIK